MKLPKELFIAQQEFIEWSFIWLERPSVMPLLLENISTEEWNKQNKQWHKKIRKHRKKWKRI